MQAILAVLLLPATVCSALTFPAINTSKFSADMQNMFFTRSIYLLHEDKLDIGRKLQLIRLQKEFLVQVAALSLSESSRIPWRSLLIVLWTTPDMLRVLQKMSSKTRLSNWKWLLLMQDDMPLHFLNTIQISVECEFVVGNWQDSNLTLSEIYQQGEIRQNILAVWSSQEGLSLLTRRSLLSRRKDLGNVTLVAAVEPDGMSIVLNNNSLESKPEIIGGYFGAVWHILEHQLNFRTELKRAPDGAWGTHTVNGSWDGMVGMLVQGEAEVAISAFTMTISHLDAVNFMAPYWKDGLTLFIRTPIGFHRTWFQLAKPFRLSLWIGVLSALVTLAVTQTITSHILPCSSGYSLSTAFFVTLASFCQQSQNSPLHWSSRIVYITSYMMAVVLLAAYSGTFISFLAVRNLSLPFTTFRGLLQDGTYRLGVLDKSAELEYFKEANDSLLQEMYRRLIARKNQVLPKAHLEGLEQLCTRPRYAFLGPNSIILSHIHSIECSITRIPRAEVPATSAMIIRKNSPYLRLINHNVLQLKRTGLLSRMLAQTTPRLPPRSAESAVHSVSIEDVTPVLVLLGFGTLLSLLILLLEIALGHANKHSRKPNEKRISSITMLNVSAITQ